MGSDFPIDWKILRLEDCMEAIIDYRGKTPRKTMHGVPLITAKIVKSGRIESPREFIDPKEYNKWMRRGLPKRGDVLITTEAPLGEVAQIDNPKVALAQRLIALRGRTDIINNNFLKFLMQSVFVQTQLASRASGTTVFGIKQSELRQVQLPLPPLKEQQAIACILGSLDDKIELNRRMNATLEAMARALFKSWFVDFDPVVWKALQAGNPVPERFAETAKRYQSGEPCPVPSHIADLFPNAFEESELGEIPRGWRVKPISELTKMITKGTTPTKRDLNDVPETDVKINYIRVNCIDEDGSIIADKLTLIPELVHAGVLKRSILEPGDILYTIAGTIGRVSLVEDWILPANTNQAVAIIRPDPSIPQGFLFLTMRQEKFRQELHSNIVHAVQANLSLGILAKAQVVVPPLYTLSMLFIMVESILAKIINNQTQSRTLAALRDTLLPRLISGELRVPDAERIVGRCV